MQVQQRDAAAAAVQEIAAHSTVRAISGLSEHDGYLFASAEVAVSLPSRAAGGASATGVREVEQVFFQFPPSYPFDGPTVFLREDFPSDLPHVNPHRTGHMVPPCVFQGSLNDLLHTAGIEAIVDQAVNWLERAASGQLMNLDQGWEPTRRGDARVALDFDGDQMVLGLPRDGAPLLVPTSFAQIGEDVLLSLLQGETQPQEFEQSVRSGRKGDTAIVHGRTPVVVAMAPWKDDGPVTFDAYRADTVTDLESLSVRARDLGIDPTALVAKLESVLSRSLLTAKNASKWPWPDDFVVGIVLAAKRPVHLIGSTREIEFIPYLLRLKRDQAGPDLSKAKILPAFHVHRISPQLLARTSGHPTADLNQPIAVLGCGSVGSKISMHLGRSGFGKQTVSDKETLVPHNLARHALIGTGPPNKALQLAIALMALGHMDVAAAPVDIIERLRSVDLQVFAQVVPKDACLIVETTASPQVAAAATHATLLDGHSGRLARAFLYNRGQAAVVLLEGKDRYPRCDDLLAELFERCRHDPQLRVAIKGSSADLTEVFVGDNCRSITMPMSDSVVSRSAAAISMELERWLVLGFPAEGQLCAGYAPEGQTGLTWQANSVRRPVVLSAAGDGGWAVRVSDAVVAAIGADAANWTPRETGGALLGHIDTIGRTITIAGLVPAPTDSVRETARFVLGTQGLKQALLDAHANSVGYLHYIGTWHSHPMGGPHSALDRQTLGEIADYAPGLPVVSLVWKPDGLVCEVEREERRRREA